MTRLGKSMMLAALSLMAPPTQALSGTALSGTRPTSIIHDDVQWAMKLGKKNPKPRNKRGSNWKSMTQATHEKKPHNQRNKKGKP